MPSAPLPPGSIEVSISSSRFINPCFDFSVLDAEEDEAEFLLLAAKAPATEKNAKQENTV